MADEPAKGAAEAQNGDSTAVVEVEMPPLEIRWAHTGTKQLALPTAPISGLDSNFKAFSADESDRIEKAWQALPAERRQAIVAMWGKGDGEWSQGSKKEQKRARKAAKKASGKSTPANSVNSASESEGPAPPANEELEKDEEYKSIIEKAQNDPSRLDSVEGVPVSQVSISILSAADGRTRCSRSISIPCHCTLCSGHSLVRECRCSEDLGSWAMRLIHVLGTLHLNWRRPSSEYRCDMC